MSGVEVCTEAECLLRSEQADARGLARLLVGLLAGEEPGPELATMPPIAARERCVDCALRVLRGGRPLPSPEEIERRVQAGRWSVRRARRRGR